MHETMITDQKSLMSHFQILILFRIEMKDSGKTLILN